MLQPLSTSYDTLRVGWEQAARASKTAFITCAHAINPSSRAMMPTTQMVPLFVVLLLTPGAAAEDGLRRVPLTFGPGPYVGRSGADLLLNSSQPAGAVLLNGRDIVSGSLLSVRGAHHVRALWRLANTVSTLAHLNIPPFFSLARPQVTQVDTMAATIAELRDENAELRTRLVDQNRSTAAAIASTSASTAHTVEALRAEMRQYCDERVRVSVARLESALSADPTTNPTTSPGSPTESPTSAAPTASPSVSPTADLCPNHGYTCDYGAGPCIYFAQNICQPYTLGT